MPKNKQYNREILPFGALCRNWRMRNNLTACDVAKMFGISDVNCIYQFEGGHRKGLYILSEYIKAGCDITYEMTRSENNDD